tara:strand:+ start:998 stop:1519 length:522 start_codon:yes stop_codon:yes gene_type:complete
MRSGILNQQGRGIDVNMMQNLVALVKTLMEDAVKSAEKFVTACGRNQMQDKDIAMALKYETHEFLLQGDSLESKFAVNLEEEKNHTYETDGESDGEEESEAEEENEGENDSMEEEEEEEYSIELKSDDVELIEIHRKFLKYHEEWDDWEPTDPISIFMKASVDKTSSQCGIFS